MVTVVRVPGVPDGVEVRRSSRRRRTVTAYREGGRVVVVVPGRMATGDIPGHVADLLARLERRERRTRPSDAELTERAARLSDRFLAGAAVPASVRWVDNQQRRWGSCTPADGTIRLSRRLAAMPDDVIDYVLLHELAHLLVPGHGPDFEALLAGFPGLARARGFLDGVAWADARGDMAPLPPPPPAPALVPPPVPQPVPTPVPTLVPTPGTDRPHTLF